MAATRSTPSSSTIEPRPALLVGLTGNVAAGKSTVAAWLRDCGCHVLDLDALNRECLAPGTATREAVVEAFGASIVAADGTVDRRALGAIVFADDAARARLEAIMHPAIRSLQRQRVDELIARTGGGIVVLEAALLYETGSAERYDRMIAVTAPDERRLRRLMARGFSAAEARQRMAAQMDQHEKAARADYVIDNDGSLAAARAATEIVAAALHRELRRRTARKPPAAGHD